MASVTRSRTVPMVTSRPIHDSSAYGCVVVTTTYQFHFVVGILDKVLPASGLTVQMVSARTINNNETTVPNPPTCGYDPGAGGGNP